MPGLIHASVLPEWCAPESLQGGIAVVIDLLRASTTITRALESGATRVIAFAEPGEAIEAREAYPNSLLGGERGGVRIEGFDLGNSPSEYTPERVGGKTVLFTTTNGTRAALRCAQASEILFGCFANLSALVARVSASDLPVHLVCAGTNGQASQEDCLCAGAIIDGLSAAGRGLGPDDQALMMRTMWRGVRASEKAIRDAMLASRGGRNLLPLGFAADVESCTRRDTSAIVPRMDARTRVITRA